MITAEPFDLSKVKVGDTVDRWLAGIVKIEQVVVKVDEQFIYTGRPDDDGWRFWRTNGFEYDPDLHLPDDVIVSFIVPPGTEVRIAEDTAATVRAVT